jgi:flagellar biogenesis protein FliO
MEAQHSPRRPGAPYLRGAAARPGRTLVLAGAILAALVLADMLVAHSATSAADPVTLAAATATPSHPRHATPPHLRPTVHPIATAPTLWRAPGTANTGGTLATPHAVATPSHTPARHTSGTPTPAATPDEAHTPINLSDPLGSGASLGTDTPWWQSAFDVTWKLALVLGLIYLAVRALVALKRRGFGLGTRGTSLAAKSGPRLLEPLEEVQLAPNHVLHAVRVGDRVFLIARTNGTLRALGEAEVNEGAPEDAAPALPAPGFAGQLLRAWAGLMPAGNVTEAPPAALPKGAAPTAPPADAVIDAKWSITPDAAPDPASDAAPVLPELPLRQGDARAGDEPPPLNASEEREILWFAEEHGDGAAAKKFGLTRQRVTAMRVRYDRERAERPRRTKAGSTARSVASMAAQDAAEAKPTHMDEPLAPAARPASDASAARAIPDPPAKNRATPARSATAPTGPAPRRPATPDHPRGTPGAEPSLPAAARTSQARVAYRQAAAPVAPDVAPTPAASDDREAGAVTVGQILAARFGIKIPQTTK